MKHDTETTGLNKVAKPFYSDGKFHVAAFHWKRENGEYVDQHSGYNGGGVGRIAHWKAVVSDRGKRLEQEVDAPLLRLGDQGVGGDIMATPHSPLVRKRWQPACPTATRCASKGGLCGRTQCRRKVTPRTDKKGAHRRLTKTPKQNTSGETGGTTYCTS